MIQGTGSSVGKSLIVTAFCRAMAQDGYRVVPFKAQNMSNNAFVTPDGLEISRAQAEQAKACGVEPSVFMNPILLKPTTETGAQIVVLGQSVGTLTAKEYQAQAHRWRRIVAESLSKLQAEADVVVIEGAGSPVEINLKEYDVANMWTAHAATARVILIGDIDRGGVFAQLVGTMELLSAEDRRLICGFLINKFRGDGSLLTAGLEWLEDRYDLPVLGVLPYLSDVWLAEEDSVGLRQRPRSMSDSKSDSEDVLRIDVIRLPRIANFADFDPLMREPDVRLRFVERPLEDPLPDCVILPGTKSTVSDLAFVRQQGLESYLRRCVEAGKEIVGICGGFQMLGREILDPDHVESTNDCILGLGWLPTRTVFHRSKVTANVRGVHLESGLPVAGYEIHMGRMQELSGMDFVFRLSKESQTAPERYDGLRSQDKRVWGTHVHGIFDRDGFRRWWLNRLRAHKGFSPLARQTVSVRDDEYDRLAEAVRCHVNLQAIYDVLRSIRDA